MCLSMSQEKSFKRQCQTSIKLALLCCQFAQNSSGKMLMVHQTYIKFAFSIFSCISAFLLKLLNDGMCKC